MWCRLPYSVLQMSTCRAGTAYLGAEAGGSVEVLPGNAAVVHEVAARGAQEKGARPQLEPPQLQRPPASGRAAGTLGIFGCAAECLSACHASLAARAGEGRT